MRIINIKTKFNISPLNGLIGIFLLIVILLYIKTIYDDHDSRSPLVLLRCDDIGLTQSVNEALVRLAEKHIPVSASVIVNSENYSHAVDILKKYPAISVGVHLTFTSEWEGHRWKPVLAKEKTASLIDSLGYFYPSRVMLNMAGPDYSQIEAEAEAQILKLINSGLKVDYIDSHMFFLYSKAGSKILRNLSKKFKLNVSQYNDEIVINDLYQTDEKYKTEKYVKLLSNLEGGRQYLFVLHLSSAAGELNLMKDLNKPDFNKNGDFRYSEFCAVISNRANKLIKEKQIKLMTYSDLRKKNKNEEL